MPPEAPEHRQCRQRTNAEEAGVRRASLLRATSGLPPINPVVQHWYEWTPDQEGGR